MAHFLILFSSLRTSALEKIVSQYVEKQATPEGTNLKQRTSLFLPSDANAITKKSNVVLYLDRELAEKSKALGFNLSKTFENNLKKMD